MKELKVIDVRLTMKLDDAIFGRHSVRCFSNKAVSDGIIREIINAGIYAPSACNLQNWKYIVVRDGDRSKYYNEIIGNAPVLIFVLYKSDVQNVTGYKHKDYVQSAAASIQNMLLKAYSMGLGSCWICDLPQNELLQEHFKVPYYYEILATVALGYPVDKSDNTIAHKLFHSNTANDYELRKRKYDIDDVLYYEYFGNSKKSEINKEIEICSESCVKDYWKKCMLKIAKPVLESCASDNLKKNMPLYSNNVERAEKYSHLEALGRTILGISLWIENETEDVDKEIIRELAIKSIVNAVNENANDYMNWDQGDQPLVDAAFMALGILQAKEQLWHKLPRETKNKLMHEMKKTRKIAPWRSNWILFSAIIEVFIYEFEGEDSCVKSVIDYAVSQFEQWYVGDGFYKDGDSFHFDYYESIVIHPFLLEISKRIPWIQHEKYITRSLRYSKILLNLINKDGTYPLIGRSLCYRGGVFHLLAKIAGENLMKENVNENIKVNGNEIRASLTAVLNKYMNADLFDSEGWLKVGVVSQQFGLAEEYVNTGSLYMFMSMFLVLGNDEIWNGEKCFGSSLRAWDGVDVQFDNSLEGWVKL